VEIVLEAGPVEVPEITVTARQAKPIEDARTTEYDFVHRALGGASGSTDSGRDGLTGAVQVAREAAWETCSSEGCRARSRS
jgi:hypothetical protein